MPRPRIATPLLAALVAAVACLAPTSVHAQDPLASSSERADLWSHERHWISVGLFTAGLATSAGLRLSGAQPFSSGLIGVTVNENGELEGDFEGEVDQLFSEVQRVSTAELMMFVGASGVVSALVSGTGVCGSANTCAGRDQALLDTSLGFLETMGATLLITDVMKYAFSRARPDYADRMRRYKCDVDPTSSACITGRLSFPSGHASLSFAAATFAGLVLGGRFVWGDHVHESGNPGASMVPGLLGQLTLAGAATYIAISRVQDSRHNISDVLVGAGIGVLVASISYFTYFDFEGRHYDAERQPDATAMAQSQPIMFSFGGAF